MFNVTDYCSLEGIRAQRRSRVSVHLLLLVGVYRHVYFAGVVQDVSC